MDTHEKFDLITEDLRKWQGRKEWFFNREHTDTYELWYEGRYKRAEVWQKKVIADLIKKDKRETNTGIKGSGVNSGGG